MYIQSHGRFNRAVFYNVINIYYIRVLFSGFSIFVFEVTTRVLHTPYRSHWTYFLNDQLLFLVHTMQYIRRLTYTTDPKISIAAAFQHVYTNAIIEISKRCSMPGILLRFKTANVYYTFICVCEYLKTIKRKLLFTN